MSYPKAVYETGEDVKVGDYVQFRAWAELWLRKRTGRVMFVPGISPPNPTLEYNGLKWISIDEEKMKIGGLVDPKTGVVKKIRFLKRSDDELQETPSGYEFEDNNEEDEN